MRAHRLHSTPQLHSDLFGSPLHAHETPQRAPLDLHTWWRYNLPAPPPPPLPTKNPSLLYSLTTTLLAVSLAFSSATHLPSPTSRWLSKPVSFMTAPSHSTRYPAPLLSMVLHMSAVKQQPSSATMPRALFSRRWQWEVTPLLPSPATIIPSPSDSDRVQPSSWPDPPAKKATQLKLQHDMFHLERVANALVRTWTPVVMMWVVMA